MKFIIYAVSLVVGIPLVIFTCVYFVLTSAFSECPVTYHEEVIAKMQLDNEDCVAKVLYQLGPQCYKSKPERYDLMKVIKCPSHEYNFKIHGH